jgi:deoxyribonuclease-4
MRKLGAFVSVAGGLANGVANGEKLGVNTIMIHPSPPQRWCTKPFDQEQIRAFNEARSKSKIKHVYMHGIYLINLAKPDKQQFHLSKLALVEYLKLAEEIGSDGVVFHVGSFKDTTEEEGFPRIAKGLNWIFEQAPGKSMLLLECAAGAGNIVGDRMEELARIYELAENKERIGFCLDTQHMFASGYDLVNKLEAVVSEIENVLGLEKVKAVHFNDSKVEFESHRDRHENIGEGKIGKKAMTDFLNHPKLRELAYIMETPGLKDPETAQSEVDKLLAWGK